jgi:hypothetical protein
MSLIDSEVYNALLAGGMSDDAAGQLARRLYTDLTPLKTDVALLQLDMRLVKYSLWMIGVLVGILLVQVFTVHS